MARRLRLALDSLLQHSEQINAAVSWPVGVHHRLDQLVELVHQAGERTTRKELSAAILLDAPEKGAALAEILQRYRRAANRQAIIGVTKTKKSLELARHGPGPRRR